MTARTTLIDIYDAWHERDFDWLGSYLPADFRHSMNIPTEKLALSGTRQGKGATLDRLREIFQAYDTRHFEVGKLIVKEDRASVDVNALHAQGNRRVPAHDEDAYLAARRWLAGAAFRVLRPRRVRRLLEARARSLGWALCAALRRLLDKGRP